MIFRTRVLETVAPSVSVDPDSPPQPANVNTTPTASTTARPRRDDVAEALTRSEVPRREAQSVPPSAFPGVYFLTRLTVFVEKTFEVENVYAIVPDGAGWPETVVES